MGAKKGIGMDWIAYGEKVKQAASRNDVGALADLWTLKMTILSRVERPADPVPVESDRLIGRREA